MEISTYGKLSGNSTLASAHAWNPTQKIGLPIAIEASDVKLEKPRLKNAVKPERIEEKPFKVEEKSVEMLDKMIKDLVKHPTELRVLIHDKTKRMIIKIIDAESQEVMKEITSESTLDAIANLMDLSGVFVDRRA